MVQEESNHHNYLKFYQFPNSNLFTHRMLFSREKPLVKSMAPGSIFSSYTFRSILLFAFLFICNFYFQIYIIKNPKIPRWILFAFICIYQSTTILSRQLDNFWHRYPKGIDNPFNTSGCKYLFFVCRYRLHSVAWFSYWFDNLGLITEGNTYRSYAASSLPLWGNTDVVQAASTATPHHPFSNWFITQ